MYETAKMSVGLQICQQAAPRLKCRSVIETIPFFCNEIHSIHAIYEMCPNETIFFNGLV